MGPGGRQSDGAGAKHEELLFFKRCSKKFVDQSPEGLIVALGNQKTPANSSEEPFILALTQDPVSVTTSTDMSDQG